MTFSYTQIALILMTIGSRFKSYIFASVLCIKEKEQTKKNIHGMFDDDIEMEKWRLFFLKFY
jgi:hypothetical protein